MLQQMRAFSKSWIASVFLGVLALSFGVWGIADIFRGGTDTSLATVGNTTIDSQSFTRDLGNIRRNFARNGTGQLSPAKDLALAHAALQHEINNVALDNSANELGLVTTDGQVSSTIRNIDAFHGPLGGFDENTFRQALSRISYTEVGFVAEIRRELTRDQLVRAGTSAFLLPAGYVQAVFSYLNERRAVQYLLLPAEAAGPIPPPSDQTLLAFVKAHPNQFSSPEYREFTYATISPDDVENQVQVTDAQLHETYELRKDTYVVPEKRDIQRINFADEASAKAARAKIDAGAKFEDIAASRGMSPADLNLGTLTQADLGSQGPPAFALPVGGISQPVKYTFGWSLLRVTKIVPGKTTTFDEAKAAIKDELTKQLAVSRVEDILNAFEDARNAGDDLAEAAKKAGMRVVHVADTDAHGYAPNGTKADVPANNEFLEQVFKSDVGNEGDPFSTQDGHHYVLKVDGVVPPKLKPLDAVRAQATAAWIASQRLARLESKAAALANEANSAKELAAIAAQYHVALQSSRALVRDTPTPVFNQELITKIFSSAPGKSVFGAAVDGSSYIVVRITGVAHPPTPLGDPRYRRFAQLLGDQAGSDIQEVMSAAARAKQGVTINQQQVDRVIGGEGP